MSNTAVDIREIIKKEYALCSVSSEHFLRKYSYIQHPVKGKIKFNLYPFQADVIKQIEEHRYTIILKGRQLGISTLMSGYGLWKMLFKPDYQILVIATTQDVAKSIVKKVQLMYENLPSWLRNTVEKENFNKFELKFSNGSSIKAVASSGKSARSHALSLLIIDEAAFIDRMEELWTAAQATLSTGGKCVILSTPNGVGNTFHRLWVQATEGVSEGENMIFHPIKLSWRVHPERDEQWAKEELAILGARQFAQEHDCDFITSGHTVVDGEILNWYQKNMVTDPIEQRYAGDLWIWDYPNYSSQYVVSADVARGDGSDYSAFHVFELDTMRQVAEFKSKIPTRDYGNLLVSVAAEYNNALLVIDNKNIGWDVVQVAIDKGYPNLYYTYKHDPFFDSEIQLRKNYDLKSKKDKVPGFTTTHKVRSSMISKLDIYFREKGVIVRSSRLINELFVFIWQSGRAEARNGYNDDLVMALCMFLFVKDTYIRMTQYGVDISRKALQNFHYRGIYTGNDMKNDSWSYKYGNEEIDLRWLLSGKRK